MSFDWVWNVNFYFLNEKGSRREFFFQRYKTFFYNKSNLKKPNWKVLIDCSAHKPDSCSLKQATTALCEYGAYWKRFQGRVGSFLKC